MKLGMKVVAFALCAAALNLVGAEFAPADVLVYTRWQYVRNPKTNQVVAKGAFHHESTEVGAEEIRRYFTANGLSCLVTDKPEVFTSEAMKKVRCIVLACTNHELFNTDAEREVFYKFIENGGGLLAIHSSSANERGKERFRKMLGGAFERHYAIQQSVPFTRIDRSHPAMACMPEGYVWEGDEIYLNHPMDDVRPLLILEWKDIHPKSRAGDKWGCPKIGGHVLEWCKTYGKGRIYYTALGHRPKDFGKMEFQLHLFKAAQWTMGLLPDKVDVKTSTARVETTLEGARCVKDGKTVWNLNLATRENKIFVHPLCLPDGRCVTDARPKDHPWHLGLWFCWKYINGLNYWEPRNPAAGNLFPDGMTVVRDFAIKPNGGACTVDVKLWYGPRAEPGRVLLDEARTLAFSAPTARGGYTITAKHTFTAREKVTFDCRRPVGYGGFSLRMSDMMRGFKAVGEGGEPNEKINVAAPKGMTGISYTDPKTGHGVKVRSINPIPTERHYSWADHRFTNPVPMYEKPLVLEKGQKLELNYEVTIY